MIKLLERYLQESIDDNIIIEPWDQKDKLSISLRREYNYFTLTILGVRCILLEITDRPPNIVQIKKHINILQRLSDRQIVLFYKDITSYRRKSLINNRIPFLVANEQMYLPFLSLDLKKAPEYLEDQVDKFSPSAQLAYLYFLYHENIVINTAELAEKLNFTNMTASRALNDLYDAKLITYRTGGKTGRSKQYQRISNPDYYIQGRNYLRNPTAKIIYTKSKPRSALQAGLDALSSLSMINPPNHRTYAIAQKEYKTLGINEVRNTDIIEDQELIEVELWDYEPGVLSDKNHVDVLSLFLSLNEEADERVEAALEEVLRGEPWYTD